MQPSKIQIKDKSYLQVTWNDGNVSSIKLSNLRNACPCAYCKVEREERGKKYIPIYTSEQLSLIDIKIFGNYALNVHWVDGHNSGIYLYDQIINLSENHSKL